MQMTREERMKLNALSLEVFGTTSRWQKMVDAGHKELVTEEVEETVPAEKEGEEATKRKVQVPVLTKTGGQQFTWKRYTVESILEFMTERKKQIDNIHAQIKKHQEEAAAKKQEDELSKRVHEEIAGNSQE